jgi:hypothetical protein
MTKALYSWQLYVFYFLVLLLFTTLTNITFNSIAFIVMALSLMLALYFAYSLFLDSKIITKNRKNQNILLHNFKTLHPVEQAILVFASTKGIVAIKPQYVVFLRNLQSLNFITIKNFNKSEPFYIQLTQKTIDLTLNKHYIKAVNKIGVNYLMNIANEVNVFICIK